MVFHPSTPNDLASTIAYYDEISTTLGNMSHEHQIVPGITVTSSGQANIDPSLTDVLFDLAIQLESTNLPVDVEHVLAAIVLAARSGELDANTPISSDDSALVEVLAVHVKTVFADFDGKVGRDD
jgi:hypothetical protein